jgi:methyltransferase-like protein
VSHPLLKAAYLCLGRAWPRALSFDELVGEARRELDGAGAGQAGADEQVLVEAMHVLACSGEVILLRWRPPLTRTVSERPLASLFARRQSEAETLVTNLLHQSVRLENEDACRILQRLDGTRTISELVDVICRDRSARSSEADAAPADPAVVAENLATFLKTASKLGLLVA